MLEESIKNSMGDFAVEDSWKVTRINNMQLLIKPGEAWLNGLPFLMRYGKDHLVSGSLLSSGIVPQFVTITDDANGGGKLVTFNVGSALLDLAFKNHAHTDIIPIKANAATNRIPPLTRKRRRETNRSATLGQTLVAPICDAATIPTAKAIEKAARGRCWIAVTRSRERGEMRPGVG